MNLKGLIQKELAEGMTDNELAANIRVPLQLLADILADKDPEDPVIWEKFARYFHMDVDFLKTGKPAFSSAKLALSGTTYQSAAGDIRWAPLLDWHQLNQMVTSKNLPEGIRTEATVETTDISGTRTFALKVPDDSMTPLFSEGEIFFVDPDSTWKPGDFVIAKRSDGHPETIVLRQVTGIGSQCLLHPLNRKYEDLPLPTPDKVWGKVVRLRKDL
ncbi:MAG: S24 family peptidase [Nitrospirota bacterium]|nr:S24 family peptidase [Nitrospirota bacterium]